MFIRKKTTVNTTIFDLNMFSKEEKDDLLETVIKNYNKDLSSIKKENKPTFLSSIGVISNSRFFERGYSNFFSALFYNDIIDLRQPSNIFKTREINKRGYNVVNLEAGIETVSVTENKTAELLKVHHTSQLNALSKKINFTNTNNRHAIKTRGGGNMVSETNDINNLNSIGYLLVLEGNCSLFEIGNFTNMLEHLTVNTHDYYGLYDALKTFNSSTVLDSILSKYDCFDSNCRHQIIDCQTHSKIGSNYTERFQVKSLTLENTDNVPFEDDTLNIFIPYTMYLFLPKGISWFKDLTDVTVEHVINDGARLLVSSRIGHYIGYPKRLNKNSIGDKSIKQQTLNGVLPDITTNDYKLNHNITFIPSNFSHRLIKSKLKKSADKSVVLKEYGNKLYNIPKSILDNEFMSDFYFFTKEQVAKINKAKESNFHYNFAVSKDGLINLSYYTDNIYFKLANRFASEFYSRGFDITDFAYNLKIFCESNLDLKELLDEVSTRQNYLNETFNSTEQTILTKEMFAYEKAVMLMLYLIKTTTSGNFGIKKIVLESRKGYIKGIKEHDYKISNNIVNNFHSYFRNYFVKVGKAEKAYLLEALFTFCYTKTDEEIENLILQIIREKENNIQYFIDRLDIYNTILRRISVHHATFQNTNYYLMDTFYLKISKLRHSSLIYYVLSTDNPVLLIKNILSDISITSFFALLEVELRTLFNFIHYNQFDTIVIKNNKIEVNCIANEKAYKEAILNYKRYNYENVIFSNTEVLKGVLEANVASGNSDLSVLLDNLLLKIKEYYESSLKNT